MTKNYFSKHFSIIYCYFRPFVPFVVPFVPFVVNILPFVIFRNCPNSLKLSFQSFTAIFRPFVVPFVPFVQFVHFRTARIIGSGFQSLGIGLPNQFGKNLKNLNSVSIPILIPNLSQSLDQIPIPIPIPT
jgi:hypothetical protein